MLQIVNQDDLVFDTDITDVMVFLALAEYSKLKPRELRSEYIGQNKERYPLPSTWSDEFSSLHGIKLGDAGDDDDYIDENEYRIEKADETARPLSAETAGQSQVTLTTIANAGFFKAGDVIEIKASSATSGEMNWAASDGNTTTGVVALVNALATTYSSPVMRKRRYVRFLTLTPVSSDRFVLFHTGLHLHDDVVSTIPDGHYPAFCHLVTALTAHSISAKFSQYTDSSISADDVDFAGLADKWAELSRSHRNIYSSLLGAGLSSAAGGETGEIPASAFIGDVDFRASHGGSMLLHPAKRR